MPRGTTSAGSWAEMRVNKHENREITVAFLIGIELATVILRKQDGYSYWVNR
jgi:hypothetical protein